MKPRISTSPYRLWATLLLHWQMDRWLSATDAFTALIVVKSFNNDNNCYHINNHLIILSLLRKSQIVDTVGHLVVRWIVSVLCIIDDDK